LYRLMKVPFFPSGPKIVKPISEFNVQQPHVGPNNIKNIRRLKKIYLVSTWFTLNPANKFLRSAMSRCVVVFIIKRQVWLQLHK
jgi:hypothetical protein